MNLDEAAPKHVGSVRLSLQQQLAAGRDHGILGRRANIELTARNLSNFNCFGLIGLRAVSTVMQAEKKERNTKAGTRKWSQDWAGLAAGRDWKSRLTCLD